MALDSQTPQHQTPPKLRFHIPTLQNLSMAELLAQAELAGLLAGTSNPAPTQRDQCIFRLLQHAAGPGGWGSTHGVLQVHPEGFGFLRSPQAHFSRGADDVYVSPSQVHNLRLRGGHSIQGLVRAPRGTESYFTLMQVKTINHRDVGSMLKNLPFNQGTAILPQSLLQLSSAADDHAMRLLELLHPVGLGQRVLLNMPQAFPRQQLWAQLAQGLQHNHPELRVMLHSIEEDEGEITALRQRLENLPHCQVSASLFGETPRRQVELAELVLDMAKREVECGRHVVLILDSLSRMVHAYNQSQPHSGKILSPGLDHGAVQEAKQYFAAARNLQEGGSLTILAAVTTNTLDPVDSAIAQAFCGRAHSQWVFSEELWLQGLNPALDVQQSSTWREASMLPLQSHQQLRRLRQHLSGLSPTAAWQELQQALLQSSDNQALLEKFAN